MRGRVGFWISVLCSLLWFVMAAGWFRGVGRVPVLADLRNSGTGLDHYPSVSVVVAARDEAETLGAALRSIMDQKYPGRLEIVAVDDRSADGTGEVLESLASEMPETLRHLRVDGLPEGWLGKNHALWVGAGKASGDWLLFTDADVNFAPDCLELAVRHATNEGYDHLTLAPELVAHRTALKSFISAFVLVFELTQRPWRASDPHAKEAVGVGSFNLVRRGAYEKVGTHRAIRMRPDDDLKLGRILKGAGFRQGVAYGRDTVRVEWHTTLSGAVEGLEKSMFPGMDYRIVAALFASLGLFATGVLPFVGALLARRPATRLLYAADVALIFVVYASGARRTRTPAFYAALHPFGASVMILAMLRSTYKTLARGGIEWRGTFYPLDELNDG